MVSQVMSVFAHASEGVVNLAMVVPIQDVDASLCEPWWGQ
jgi:hypothetical protein